MGFSLILTVLTTSEMGISDLVRLTYGCNLGERRGEWTGMSQGFVGNISIQV